MKRTLIALDNYLGTVEQNNSRETYRAKHAKLAKAPPIQLFFSKSTLAPFALFARDTILSDLLSWQNFKNVWLVFTLLLFIGGSILTAEGATKVSFPFTPISAASLPWWIAKEARYYEKYGLDVDMIYVGASPVIIQTMLGGQAGVGAGGGPPLVTNVLQGGDVVQVATTIPYAIQSLIVRPEIKTPADLVGKKIGISRLGAIPHFTLQAIVKLHNVQGIAIVQTGTTTQAIASLSQGLVDGIITSAPFTFRLMKDGYRELVGPKEFKKAGVEFLIQGLVARKSFAAKNREVVIGMIKATMEGTRQIFVNEKQAKAVLAKYTRQSDPEILEQTHRFALDIFVKDPTVTPNSIQPIVQQSAQFNLVDAKLAGSTPITTYFDNSYIDEIKRTGWLAELWR